MLSIQGHLMKTGLTTTDQSYLLDQEKFPQCDYYFMLSIIDLI